MPLYPLKFNPIFKYRIWGGHKLKSVLNKDYDAECIGESWEISAVYGDETNVANGNLKGYTLKQLIQEFNTSFLGQNVYNRFGDEFPLLIKFIDSKEPLSIQVHPNDELAKSRHNSFGKEEMWYILDTEENAEITIGFKDAITKNELKYYIENNTITDILNIERIQKGDTYHIKGGIVHAIGAGVLLAEIQQTSDITYRIYDYDRIDSRTGKKRELHTAQAIDAIDFKPHPSYKTSYKSNLNTTNTLVNSPYFKTNFLPVKGLLKRDYSHLDSFLIYICTNGVLNVSTPKGTETITKGECLLLPACIKHVELHAYTATLIEVFI